MATAPDGSLYVLGASKENGEDVFVGKVNATTAQLLWSRSFGGSGIERPGGIAVDSAGNAYFTGYTNSPDFPVLPKTMVPAPAKLFMPFAAKLDSSGNLLYSVLFNGGDLALPEGIAVDSLGRAVITGTTGSATMSSTPGAYSSNWYPSNPPFVVKLDASGTRTVFAVAGVGGSRVAIDASDNIFIAGSSLPFPVSSGIYPTTPGAYQASYTPGHYCLSPGCGIPAPLGHQYVTKLSADGSSLIYSTFLSALGGTVNSGLAVDADGNAWVTGKAARGAPYPYTDSISGTSRESTFTTKLDPTGSKVLVSVRQGGSTLSLDGKGGVIVADTLPAAVPFVIFSTIALPDPPTGTTPSQCLPTKSPLSRGAFLMRLSSSDGSILGTRILSGSNLDQTVSTADREGNVYVAGNSALPDVPLTPGIAFDSAIGARNTPGIYLLRTFGEVSSPKLGCVTDATSSALTSLVAPGQLISIYGSGIGPADPMVGMSGGSDTVATSLGGVTVSFNGRPAPLLYVSPGQLNVQVPFEVEVGSAEMQVSLNGAMVGSRQVAVVASNPGLFVASILPTQICNGVTFGSLSTALALNEDGSLNSCDNPAKKGSQVTLFVNGLGSASRRKVTGSIVPVTALSIDAYVAAFQGNRSLQVSSFAEQAGAITGLGELRLRVPETSPNTLSVTLEVSGEQAGPFTPAGAIPQPTPVTLFVKP